jgi:hypothetical protein
MDVLYVLDVGLVERKLPLRLPDEADEVSRMKLVLTAVALTMMVNPSETPRWCV